MAKKTEIKKLLRSTKREGMEALIDWLDEEGYFTGPASRDKHAVYAGGLVDHSYEVFSLFELYNYACKLGCPDDSLIIAPLLHDACKVGRYIKTGKNKYKLTPKFPKGHGSLSIKRIEEWIELTPLERDMILYHMGPYGAKEVGFMKPGDYTLRGGGLMKAWNKPIVKMMYLCDELASMKEKANCP